MVQQSFCRFLYCPNVGTNLIERSQPLGFIEIFGETQFITNYIIVRIDNGIGRIWKNLVPNKSFDTSFIGQWNLFLITQRLVDFDFTPFVLDDNALLVAFSQYPNSELSKILLIGVSSKSI